VKVYSRTIPGGLRLFRTTIIAAVLFTTYCQLTLAQQTLGAINGSVADSSGAMIRGADVKARAVATNLAVTATPRPMDHSA
jgi:hypothetical protein